MKKGMRINWNRELDIFQKKMDMDHIMKTAKMLAKRMERQTFLDDKIQDRKSLDANLEKAVQETFKRPPKGPWNGLVLFKKMAIFALDNYSCVYCGLPASSLDHLVPKAGRGKVKRLERTANIVSSCRACNTEKAGLHIKKFEKKIRNDEKPKRLMEQAKHWTEQPEYAETLKKRAKGLTKFLKKDYKAYHKMASVVAGNLRC